MLFRTNSVIVFIVCAQAVLLIGIVYPSQNNSMMAMGESDHILPSSQLPYSFLMIFRVPFEFRRCPPSHYNLLIDDGTSTTIRLFTFFVGVFLIIARKARDDYAPIIGS